MRRKVGIFLVFGAVVPLAVASVAWACGVLATLSVDKKVVSPGQTVNATGRNYSTAAGASAVSIRLRTRDGQVVATTAAQTGGGISTDFVVPQNLPAGWYVLLATQTNANGTQKAGTPGRTTLRVAPPGQAAAVAGAPWSSKPQGPAASTASSGGSLSLLALLFAGSLSLAMLASGWKLLSRKSRSVAQPHFGV